MNKRQKKKREREFWRRYNKLKEKLPSTNLIPIRVALDMLEVCALKQYEPYKNMLKELKNKERCVNE